MHHRYNTEAIVIATFPKREADRTVVLLTPELGRVYAAARGVRKQGAKLAPALQTYACIAVSLVRGRSEWRIIGAEEKFNAYYAARDMAKSQQCIARILSLARRLVAGESNETQLYHHVRAALMFLSRTDLTSEERQDAECLTVLRMLAALGYVGKHPRLEPFLTDSEFSRETVAEITPVRRQAIHTINTSLSASEL